MSKSPPILAILILGSAIACSSPAHATCPVPNTLTNGQVADAAQMMGNFNALSNCSVSTTGSPTNGSLPVFTGTKSVGAGNLTGDVTTSGGTATTLATSGVTPGSYTNANITVDAKGRVTTASAGDLSGDVTTSGSNVTTLATSGVTSGSYYNANITVDAKGRVTAAANGSSGSGGTAAWTPVGSWAWSANVPNVDFTLLGGYNEVLFIARGVSASVSGVRLLRVSVNGGTTFYSTSGDYVGVDAAGTDTNGTGFSHSTNTTSARTLIVHIVNMKGAYKMADVHTNSSIRQLFIANSSEIDALRFTNSTGGNLTAGSAMLLAR